MEKKTIQVKLSTTAVSKLDEFHSTLRGKKFTADSIAGRRGLALEDLLARVEPQVKAEEEVQRLQLQLATVSGSLTEATRKHAEMEDRENKFLESIESLKGLAETQKTIISKLTSVARNLTDVLGEAGL